MTPLIDATEMYLRTVWELEEEGVPALRARLVERLGVSAPAVSETVARLAEDGLLELDEKRRVRLTETGRHLAAGVMRKHRLAERLLTDVIGLDSEHAHNEACRWEHVISDMVEARLVEVLGDPTTSPFGNPIPTDDHTESWADLVTVREAAESWPAARLQRISERLQVDVDLMRRMREAGLRPGVDARLSADGDHVVMAVDGVEVRMDHGAAELVWVSAAGD